MANPQNSNVKLWLSDSAKGFKTFVIASLAVAVGLFATYYDLTVGATGITNLGYSDEVGLYFDEMVSVLLILMNYLLFNVLTEVLTRLSNDDESIKPLDIFYGIIWMISVSVNTGTQVYVFMLDDINAGTWTVEQLIGWIAFSIFIFTLGSEILTSIGFVYVLTHITDVYNFFQLVKQNIKTIPKVENKPQIPQISPQTQGHGQNQGNRNNQNRNNQPQNNPPRPPINITPVNPNDNQNQ